MLLGMPRPWLWAPHWRVAHAPRSPPLGVHCCCVLPLHEGRTVGLPSAVLAVRSSRHLLAMPTIGPLAVATMAAGLASIAPDDVPIIIAIVAVGVHHLCDKFMLPLSCGSRSRHSVRRALSQDRP
jgi:hypothetical protein